ncbi:MAG: hypothetical protein ACLFRU_01410 [Paracoccaceae bacterium]
MAYLDFDKRLRRIDRKRRKLARGQVPYVDRNGLVTYRPRRGFRLPLRGLVMFALGFIGFKAVVLANLGPQIYADRVDQLAAGTVVEKAGAWLMQADPATMWIALQLWPLFH